MRAIRQFYAVTWRKRESFLAFLAQREPFLDFLPQRESFLASPTPEGIFLENGFSVNKESGRIRIGSHVSGLMKGL